MKPRSLALAVIAVIGIAIGLWTSYWLASPPPAPETATVLPSPGEVPEFSLVDHNGAAIGREVFEGQWDLVFFGFTHCPDVCPLTMQVLAAAKSQLAAADQEPLPRVVLVSVDPERDTPKLMREYVGHFGDDNLGISGELGEIRKLTKGLGIYFEKSGSGDNYSVDHSAVVLLINPQGQLHALFGTPHEAGNFVHDLPIIMAASPIVVAPIVASDIVITSPAPGSKMAAGYLTLRNNSDRPITITAVTSPNYGSVDMHESVIEDGIARMRALGGVTIPPRESLRFEPGGKHLMLMRPRDDTDTVTLDFYSRDTVVLAVSAPREN